MLPVIFGLSGPELTPEERVFFSTSEPLGYILFARNIESSKQLLALTNALRDLHGRENLPILVDQEGGRVARMTPPHWRAYPAAARFGALWQHNPEAAIRAAQCNYEALGLDLALVGINVDCAPVLDVPVPGAHDVIGDRAYGSEVQLVATLGRATRDGLRAAGVAAVIKHIPGHGRARADSHQQMPIVTDEAILLEDDLRPFVALADAPMAMTAHVQYNAWDEEHCATLSPKIIQTVIRERIGFDGLLMTDDLDMKALSGDLPTLAQKSLAAGCDVVLNCWGKLPDMEAIAGALDPADVSCRRRLQAAFKGLPAPGTAAMMTARQREVLSERDRLLGTV